MSNKHTQTISVGIPAYNEEHNIASVIKAVRNQEVSHAEIVEIIIVSDGSTDNTESIIRSIKDDRIRLIVFSKQRGLAEVQNMLAREADTDILVMLDADISINDKKFVEHLIKPILKDQSIGLTSAEPKHLAPRNFFEKILQSSHEFKHRIFRKYNNGDNSYMCSGCARAFTKDLYSQISWPVSYAEDVFSYLFAKQKGFSFLCTHNTEFYITLPSVLKDHARQSDRYFDGKAVLEKYFDADKVKRAYALPLGIMMYELLSYFLRQPVLATSYSMIIIYVRLFSRFKSRAVNENIWEISKTTKD